MDGFDLGIGILFPFAPGSDERDRMMHSVAPVWDANETWLVLGGAGLLAAFPLAYSVLLTAFYLPLTVMLIALIFRGVAFEFRFKAERSRLWWGIAFHLGSLLAAFSQGMVLGSFINGIPVSDRSYTGGALDWFSPFSLMTGLGLVSGYALLGCSWLIMKTDGRLQDWAYRAARPLLFGVLACIAIVSLWTPFLRQAIADRWFSWPNMLYLSPVPLLTALLAWLLYRAVVERRDGRPFAIALALFLLSYGGLAISLWPNVIPPRISIWEAAAAPDSMGFLLAGTIFVIPVVLFYTAYSYYVFRGKVGHDEGY
jgi:cytochrome d ubiquinol oxidase subunit II